MIELILALLMWLLSLENPAPPPSTTTTLAEPGYVIDCAELDDDGNFVQWIPCPFDQP